MKEKEGNLTGVNDCQLYYKIWEPKELNSRAVLVITHGAGEHIGRYRHFVNTLVPAGFVLAGHDQRGHGKSEGKRGHIDDWEEYRGDLRRFIDMVGKLYPSLPLFLYGHSMGSLVALDYLIYHQRGLAGAVISGTSVEPKKAAPPHLVFLVKVLSGILPRFSLNVDLQGGELSRDDQTASAYMDDPLVHWNRTFRWGAEGLKVIESIKEKVSEIELPILFVHGACDRLVSVEGAKYCFEGVRSQDKEIKVYADCLHEPHNDLDYKIVIDDIKNWLYARSQETYEEC
jgi:alpha-beta hydrolase superfamily lysophospholipase